jgi:hypothetical protein
MDFKMGIGEFGPYLIVFWKLQDHIKVLFVLVDGFKIFVTFFNIFSQVDDCSIAQVS